MPLCANFEDHSHTQRIQPAFYALPGSGEHKVLFTENRFLEGYTAMLEQAHTKYVLRLRY